MLCCAVEGFVTELCFAVVRRIITTEKVDVLALLKIIKLIALFKDIE